MSRQVSELTKEQVREAFKLRIAGTSSTECFRLVAEEHGLDLHPIFFDRPNCAMYALSVRNKALWDQIEAEAERHQ